MNNLHLSLANEMEVDYDEYTSDCMTPDEQKFYKWFLLNEDEINIKLHELGALLERDFDYDEFVNHLYADFLLND